MRYATLTLSPDQYAQYHSRGCPYLLFLASKMGLTVSPAQLEQDLLFLLLANQTQPRFRMTFYAKLIVIYYFHRTKSLPLETLFHSFHISTSATNLQAYHRLCQIKEPSQTSLTHRQAELKLCLDNIRQQFQLSEECIHKVAFLCRSPRVQHYLVRHVVAAAVLSIKRVSHLKGVSTADLAAWAHCCSSTLCHLRHCFDQSPLSSTAIFPAIPGEG